MSLTPLLEVKRQTGFLPLDAIKRIKPICRLTLMDTCNSKQPVKERHFLHRELCPVTAHKLAIFKAEDIQHKTANLSKSPDFHDSIHFV